MTFRLKTEEQRSRHLPHGFTLLEVMIALAVVAIALVTLLGLGNRSISVNARLQKITQATLLAQEKLSELQIEASQAGFGFREEEKTFDEPFAEYRWRVRYEDSPLPQLKVITVIVAWGDEKKNEMVELNSFVFH